MIQILIRIYGATYLAVVDQTPGLLSGDPDSISSQLNTGFLQLEDNTFMLQEDNNFINLE